MSSLKAKVKKMILHAIRNGEFPVNEYLPPPEVISEKVDCSVETTRVAIRELATTGILKSNKRWGTLVQKLPPMGKVCLLPSKDTHTNYILQEALYVALIEAGFDVETQLPVFENRHVFDTMMRMQTGQTPANYLIAVCPESYVNSPKANVKAFLATFELTIAYHLDQAGDHAGNMVSVSTDPYVASRLVAEHFLSQGHKRIAVHAGMNERDFSTTGITSQCFKQLIEMSGATCFLHRMADGHKHLLDLIRKENVTAYWTLNDHSARQDIAFFNSHGLKVPDDIVLVGKHDTPWSTESTPTLTSVSLNPKEVAAKMVSILNKHIKTGRTEGEKILVEPELVVRESSKHIIEE